jgi:hypothetical protein
MGALGDAVSWERRLRDMILAGGALTAVACGSSSSTRTSVPEHCCNAGGDPCCSLQCLGAADPNGEMYRACEQSLAECEARDGSYDPQADGPTCTVGAADADAGPGDAGDAGDDAHD